MFSFYKNQFDEKSGKQIEINDLKLLLKSNQAETETANKLFLDYYNASPSGYIGRKISGENETEEIKHKRLLKEKYAKFKQNVFPFVTFNCTMYDSKNHLKENILEYSGYMILDYDELTNQDIQELISILKNDPYVALIFKSPSDHGIKVLVKINNLERLKNDDHYFKEYFDFVKDHYELKFKNVLNKDYKTDISGSNTNRGCYIPFDKDFIFNESPKCLSLPKDTKKNVTQQVKPNHTKAYPSSNGRYSEITKEEINLLIKYVDIIYDNKISIANDYDSWIRIGFCIKRYISNLNFGKELFDKVSSVSPNYRGKADCDLKYEKLYNGTSTKEIGIKYIDKLIKRNSNFQVYLEKNERDTLKLSVNFKIDDLPKIMKQDNFKIIENIINHNILISWDGQKEINISKLGNEGEVKLRQYFLENYDLDIAGKANTAYCLYCIERTFVNPPIELMKEFSNKYRDMVVMEQNFIKMCSLIPTDVSLESKTTLLKHYLLSVINNLTYSRGTGRKCDEMLILRSEDGHYGKTEFIRNILFAPIINWKDQFMYKESNNFRENNKDLLYQDLSTVINYKPEISRELTRNANSIKQYLSIEYFSMRRAYRADEEEFLTRTSFIGDTNDEFYLPNDSNLRRFLVLNITAPLKFKVKKDGKWFNNGDINFEMVWAYLYQLHISGITYDTIEIPSEFKNLTEQISTDYDDAIIRKAVKPQRNCNDYFTIDELILKLKENNFNIKDTSYESIRVKLKNLGLKAEPKWDKYSKKTTRKFYPGYINFLDSVGENEINGPYPSDSNPSDDLLYSINLINVNELKRILTDAVLKEDYEKAIMIKKELTKRNVG